MTCRSRANWLWAAAWVLTMVYVSLTMVRFRLETLETMSTPQAQADWDRLRADARAHSKLEGPVQRRVPTSAEPPSLVLMRDYFPVMFTASLVFSTALFLMLLFAIKGSLWRKPPGGAASGGCDLAPPRGP